jgi:hypothetical protein
MTGKFLGWIQKNFAASFILQNFIKTQRFIDARARPTYLRIRVGEDETERLDRVEIQREAEAEFGDGSGRRRASAALPEGRGVGGEGEGVVKEGVQPALPPARDVHRHGGVRVGEIVGFRRGLRP